jgi:hypothetical protein
MARTTHASVDCPARLLSSRSSLVAVAGPCLTNGFTMLRDGGVRQQCLIESEALSLLAGRHLMSGEMLEAFERHRDAIEAAAIRKFATGALDRGLVVIERRDVFNSQRR